MSGKKRNIKPQSKRRVLKGCHSNEQQFPDMLRFNEKDLYPNNETCPECGGEMFDDRSRIIEGNPPAFKTYCKLCHYNGTRVIS